MRAPFPDSKPKDRMLVLPKSPAQLKVLGFAVVGAVNTLVDFGVFSIAWIVLGLSPLISNVLAWFVAASGSYVMNCLTTFFAESKGRVSLRTYAAFLASGFSVLLAVTFVMLIATTIIPVIAAKLLAIAASFACNFSLAHFVIFNNRVKRDRVDPHPSMG